MATLASLIPSPIPPPQSLQAVLPALLIPISCVTSLATHPTPGRTLFWTLLTTSLFLQSLISPWPVDTQLRYSLRQIWFAYFPTMTHLLFTAPSSPESELWRVSKGKKEALYLRAFSLEKWKWAAALWINPRGVGWNFQLKNVPSAPWTVPGYSRRKFLVKQTLSFAFHCLLLEACLLGLRSFFDPMSASGTPVGLRSRERDIDNITTLGWAIIQTLITVLTYTTWYTPWLAVSIIGVGLGLSEPKDWPPFFGHIRHCTTVAYYWGTYWHQALHKPVLDCGHFLVNTFRIPRRTAASRIVYLFTSFFISGFFHAVTFADLKKGEDASSDSAAYGSDEGYWRRGYPVNSYVWYSTMLFFVSQAVGILLESFVIAAFERATRKAGGKQRRGVDGEKPSSLSKTEVDDTDKPFWKRILGYVWVWSWLFVSGRLYADMLLRTDMIWWKAPVPVLGWLFGL